jgi:hypothetical protein
MGVRLLPRRREIRRAERRLLGRFFGVMAIVTIIYALLVAGHYLTGWW